MKERLMELRKYLGLSRASFGAKLGVSGDVINNLERGRVEMKDLTFNLIVKTFNVSPEWLRFGTGEMFQGKNETLDTLVKEYDLSNADIILVERFLKLNKTQRDAVIEFVKQLADAFIEKEKEEMTTEAAEAAYRQALGIAPPTKSIPSSTIEGTQADSSEEADGVC